MSFKTEDQICNILKLKSNKMHSINPLIDYFSIPYDFVHTIIGENRGDALG